MAAIKDQAKSVTLKELLSDVCEVEYFPEIEIKGITLDSRKVQPGYAFVALEGQLDHGLVYAEAALNRGAVVVICDAQFDTYCQQILTSLMVRVACVPVNNLQSKLGEIANKFFDKPSQEIFVTGVTGTDGKTSVSHFIAQAMNKAESPSAVIGTLGNGVIDKLEESTHTTPDVISLHEMMDDFKQRGISNVAMEVSSHGLDQERIVGIDFNVAVLTNLSRDHLDYHGDLESYKQAKKKLFSNKAEQTLVLNADDDFGDELFAELEAEKTIWLYGLDEKKVKSTKLYAYASEIENQSDGIKFLLESSHGTSAVCLKLIGEFNIYNVLACFCVLIESGVNFNHAVKRLEKLHTVAGRMELLTKPGKPSVVIDYAHTPEALKQALINVRKHANGKVICVFGCGGDRDEGKRPIMAIAAEELSDLVVVTNDNPRNESPEKIIEDIQKGIKNELHLIIEMDRKKAIQQSINMAGEGDLVLIAGKGHETYQIIGSEKQPFNDKEIALDAMGANA